MLNLFLYTTTVLIWGSTWFVITFQLQSHVDPLISIAYRFGISGVVLLLFMALMGEARKINIPLKSHFFIALQGLFLFSVSYWLFYEGTKYITSGLVAVIFSMLTIMNIINQALCFKIKVKKQVVAGSILGLIGIVAVFWHEIMDHEMTYDAIKGILFCAVAVYIASLGNMAAFRNTRAGIPVTIANGFGMIYGACICLVIALFMGAKPQFDFSFNYVWSLLYLALLGSVVGFSFYLTLIKRMGADRAAYTSVLFPIVALVISTIFENYTWSASSAMGVALILCGNICAMANMKTLRLFKQNPPD